MRHMNRNRAWVAGIAVVALLLAAVWWQSLSGDRSATVVPNPVVPNPVVSNPVASDPGELDARSVALDASGPAGLLRGPPDGRARPARPAPRGAGASARALTGIHTWWDGDRRMTSWLDPSLLVEFLPASGRSAVAESGLAKRMRQEARGVRLWELPQSEDPVEASSTLAGTSRAYPVFRDGPHGGAAIRALTGRIVLQIEPSWTETQVAAWATAKGLRLVRRLPIGSDWLVFEVDGGGLESLRVANEVRKDSHVLSAAPDWWRERALR